LVDDLKRHRAGQGEALLKIGVRRSESEGRKRRGGHNSVAFTLDTYVDHESDMQNGVVEHQQKRFYG
jgi:hypothetical protein